MTADELKSLRKSRGQTRDELAKALNCSAAAIVHWENDTRSIPDWVVEKLMSTTTVDLPLGELQRLLQFVTASGGDFKQILSEAISSYLEAQEKDMGDPISKQKAPTVKAGPNAKIVQLPKPSTGSNEYRSAEDPAHYG